MGRRITSSSARGNRWVIVWLLVTLSAVLTLGTLRARGRYHLRGLPAALPEPIAHSTLRLGINVQLEQYDPIQLDATLAQIAQTEFRVLKQSFYHSADFDFQQTDQLLAAVAEHGLQLVPLLDGDPNNQFAPPPDPNTFAAWAGDFAARYADQIDYYIIWDEPNLASHWGGVKVNPDEYAALLNAAGQAIGAADPTAYIVAAPLAPTTETDSLNLSDPHYLQQMYEAGAMFDVAAAKPYGFDSGPDDRTVRLDTLNFSRIILLREVMLANDDGGRALWAGNWGWNALPPDWTGDESIWGDTTQAEQHQFTQAAIRRAQTEWPWIGTLFLESWQPIADATDPAWGFRVADSALETLATPQDAAYSGFHFADAQAAHATWEGDWRFSAEFGADSSEKYVENGDVRDRVTFTFWGTDVGVRVRRADFRSRYYVTVDGQPANLRPRDEHGTTIVLDAPNPNEDYLVVEPVAGRLTPGEHTIELVAHRGWDQWALNGFSVGYRPSTTPTVVYLILSLTALLGGGLTVRALRGADWSPRWQTAQRRFAALSQRAQLLLVGALASTASVMGWHLWSASAIGIYRRLGDWQQVALTAGVASLFFVTPWFFVYMTALVLLIVLISFRPHIGLALIAFCIPFYGRAMMVLPLFGPTGLYKTVFDRYLFSPTEIFTLVVLAAILLRWLVTQFGRTSRASSADRGRLFSSFKRVDWAVVTFVLVATVSLAFTERRDVAFNEWRWVIVEPALFYLLIRCIQPQQRDWRLILDSFALSGIVVALYGLAQLIFGFQDLITAEFGLKRIQSIYGSPNNVTLYFGRILPLLLAIVLFSDRRNLNRGRRRYYLAAILLLGITFVLTISKGGILVGMPVALLIMLGFWLRKQGRVVWPYLLGCLVLGGVGFLMLLQVPQLAGRLDLFGATSFVRVNLWRASIEMIRENPWFGVGMDNFLYAHRGRYILEAAWREPNLNHPHNLVLDFATRLGLIGLLAGGWLFVEFGRLLRQLLKTRADHPYTIGLIATFGYILAHGTVDHSYFLIDLAFAFFLLLGLANALTIDDV